jgi:hypothetical protein
MTARELNVDKETVRQILTENLKMKKSVCQDGSKEFERRSETEQGRDVSKGFGKIEEDPDFLNGVVTCDETWLFQYDPETKRQSMQWKITHCPRPKKAQISKSKIKTMLVIFFDIQGIIMTRYVPRGQTVNQMYYIELLTKL